jgi:aminopeptidase N
MIDSMKKYVLLFLLVYINCVAANAQYTNADTLRGSNGIGRNWWNITNYDIEVEPNLETHALSGVVKITFNNTNIENGQIMQIDLQMPMQIDSIGIVGKPNAHQYLKKNRVGNVYFITGFQQLAEKNNVIVIAFSGIPRIAKNAPWDGGLIWKTDADKMPFVSVACQHLGASVWYPCKDIQSDEPDSGASITIITPENLQGIGNGRLVNTIIKNKKKYNTWQVSNPINNYNLVFYIGNYVPIKKNFNGLNGKLDCTFWALAGNKDKAEKSFEDVFSMLASFEKWFGPYPWYADGYQLVEAPHLGMEHQSAIAYGNQYKKGYLGVDLSGTGWGKKWDYIIVHESGHEWWGNAITTNDIADMWIHEGFTTFSEGLFVEEQFGKAAGQEYLIGLRKNITNKDALISNYGINEEPTGDIYYKGANLLLTIRTIINDDEKFRRMLQEMQKQFGKKTCNSVDIEQFMCLYSNIDLMPVFQQYIYTNQVPKLQYKFKKNSNQTSDVTLSISECNDNFSIPYWLPISATEYKSIMLKPKQPITINTSLSAADFEKLLKKGYYFLQD